MATKKQILKHIWVGIKIALKVALKADEVGLIRVKELPKIQDVVDEIDVQTKTPRF